MPLTKPIVLASGLLAALAIPLLLVLHFFEDQELNFARDRVHADVLSAASKLEMFLSDRLRGLRLLANHLATRELDKESFTSAAADFNLALPGLKAINWIYPDGTIAWVYPEQGNQAAQGRNVLDHPQASNSFVVARRSHVVALTPPLKLFQGTWGVASYTPVVPRNEMAETVQADGYLNGVFELDSIIALALEPELLAHYRIELVDGAKQIFPSQPLEGVAKLEPNPGQAKMNLARSTTILIHDRTWKLTMRPAAGSWIHRQGSVFTIARWASLFFSAAIALGIYQLLIRRKAEQQALLEKEHMLDSLRQAQKLEVVGRLAGNVAHDFNNLMTTIVGNASLLESSPQIGESENKRLEQIQLACDRATGLTSQLLAFSSQGSGSLEECEVRAEFQLLLPLLRALVPGEIDVSCQYDCESAFIGWAPTQLAQVLTNLLSNSADAYEGPGKIQLSLRRNDERNQICIEVIDHGCGMAQDVLARVTEPFFTTKPTGHGTGLGLASVSRIVANADGKLHIDSHPGDGTTVRILLPIIQPNSPLTATPQATAPPMEELQVLLVEDKAPVRDAIQSMLEELSHQIVAVNSGHQAVQQIQSDYPFDLVITDFKMPGMNGLELIRQLRGQGVAVPAVICSGYAENLDTEEILSLKVTFLAKPFAADALGRAIRAAFEAAKTI